MNNDLLAKYKIEFADLHAAEFADFLSGKELEATKELEAIRFFISKNGDEGHSIKRVRDNITNNNSGTYSANLSWIDKIKCAINAKGKPMTSPDIVDYISSKEPGLDKEKVGIAVITTISRTKDKYFTKHKHNGRGYKYGVK
jgi:hypothetical protein